MAMVENAAGALGERQQRADAVKIGGKPAEERRPRPPQDRRRGLDRRREIDRLPLHPMRQRRRAAARELPRRLAAAPRLDAIALDREIVAAEPAERAGDRGLRYQMPSPQRGEGGDPCAAWGG